MTDLSSIIAAGSSATTTILIISYMIYKACQNHHISFHSKCSKCCEFDINDVQEIVSSDIQQMPNQTVNVNVTSTPATSTPKSPLTIRTPPEPKTPHK